MGAYGWMVPLPEAFDMLQYFETLSGILDSKAWDSLPSCRRLLFPLLHAEKGRLRRLRRRYADVPFPRATKEIGDVCTHARDSAFNDQNFPRFRILQAQISQIPESGFRLHGAI